MRIKEWRREKKSDREKKRDREKQPGFNAVAKFWSFVVVHAKCGENLFWIVS
jgi:hypothetical protein